MDGVRQQDQGLVGEAAARLPWLCPSADALIRLADEPVPISTLSAEVGLVLLALRYVRSTTSVDDFSFSSLRESVVAEAGAKLLETHSKRWLDAAHPVAVRLQDFSGRLATVARDLAEQGGNVSPDAASAVGLLAPLGWWAAATVDPVAAEKCWQNLQGADNPLEIQKLRWGLSHEEIARRLAIRWRLPAWLGACLTTVTFSLGDAVRLGADPELASILRGAIGRVESETPSCAGLLRPAATETISRDAHGPAAVPNPGDDPRSVRLLPQLLRSAARTRRIGNEHRVRATEAEVDRLRSSLADLRDGFEIAVRDAKLSGLAEVSAGAGHEINNPLAVISGTAQRLRKTEIDLERRKSLDTIIRQSGRISEIVRGLMHYARPAPPNRTLVYVHELITLAVADHQPQASMKGIRLYAEVGDFETCCFVDFAQVRRSLDAVLQNAIDATPNGGEIRIAQKLSAGRTRIRVEDTGSGPSDAAVAHLFDPFFSGRSAGRGRGLGLATAWRLVNVNGGEITFHRDPNGPTRFELAFPTVEPAVPSLRKPA